MILLRRKIGLDSLRERAQMQAERYARALRVHCDTKVYNATHIGCGRKVDLTINSLQAKTLYNLIHFFDYKIYRIKS